MSSLPWSRECFMYITQPQWTSHNSAGSVSATATKLRNVGKLRHLVIHPNPQQELFSPLEPTNRARQHTAPPTTTISTRTKYWGGRSNYDRNPSFNRTPTIPTSTSETAGGSRTSLAYLHDLCQTTETILTVTTFPAQARYLQERWNQKTK